MIGNLLTVFLLIIFIHFIARNLCFKFDILIQYKYYNHQKLGNLQSEFALKIGKMKILSWKIILKFKVDLIVDLNIYSLFLCKGQERLFI